MNKTIILMAACMMAACQQDHDPVVTEDQVFESLPGAALRAHIEVLAVDDMQGREAGTIGHQAAADYVAARFAQSGLQALGDEGTYFQQLALLESRLVEGSEHLSLQAAGQTLTLEAGEDFLCRGGFANTTESITAPLVFVGYGIRAPEYDHDDFAGVDVRGKILVTLTGAPPGFATDERAFYSSGTGKQALAGELGAAGIITLVAPADKPRLTWPRLQGSAASADMRWLHPNGEVHEGFPGLAANAVLSDEGERKLFELAGRDLAALFEHHANGGTGSFELGVIATLAYESVQHRTTSPNVVALLPGSDPELKNEYLLFTAHLDGLGIRPGDGDEIYNGAYDNAAGVATLIEIAAAMAARPPRRSLIFAALTAEEKGLRGSDYLAHHPPVRINDIVANINMDMPYLGHPIADVEGLGVEHSTLHEALVKAAAEHGLALTPDPRPELVRLIRSDQFSFVKKGVPGLNLKAGSNSSDPSIDGAALRDAFLSNHYHQPSDDLALPFSEEGASRYLRVALSFGLNVANDDERPRWLEGDFFGERFAPQQSEAGEP